MYLFIFQIIWKDNIKVYVNKKFTVIENLHKNSFDSCRYFLDETNKRDLIITTSLDRHVKVINFKSNNSEIILDLNFEEQKEAIINTACYIHETLVIPFSKEGIIKFYSLKPECLSQLDNAGFVLGLSKYYDEETKEHFIFSSNLNEIIAYNIDEFKIYHKFTPNTQEQVSKTSNFCFSEAIIIKTKQKQIILAAPSFNTNKIYLWDFKKKIFKNSIPKYSNCGFTDIFLWQNKYIFASLKDSASQFIIIDVETSEIIKDFKGIGKDTRGGQVRIVNHKSGKDFLISVSLSGRLSLYTVQENEDN